MTDEEYIEMIKNCSELELFLTIDALGMFVWRMNHDLADGRIGDTEKERQSITKDIRTMQERLEKTVPHCERFGVRFELVEKPNEILGGTYKTACDEYWQWYRHWDEWKKALTDDQWNEFQRLKNQKGDFSHLLPKHDWLGNLKISPE